MRPGAGAERSYQPLGSTVGRQRHRMRRPGIRVGATPSEHKGRCPSPGLGISSTRPGRNDVPRTEKKMLTKAGSALKVGRRSLAAMVMVKGVWRRSSHKPYFQRRHFIRHLHVSERPEADARIRRNEEQAVATALVVKTGTRACQAKQAGEPPKRDLCWLMGSERPGERAPSRPD